MSIKAYLWEGVFCDYTDGMAFAMADTLEEAKELVIASGEKDFGRDFMAKELDKKEPRVIEGPFGFHIWGGG